MAVKTILQTLPSLTLQPTQSARARGWSRSRLRLGLRRPPDVGLGIGADLALPSWPSALLAESTDRAWTEAARLATATGEAAAVATRRTIAARGGFSCRVRRASTCRTRVGRSAALGGAWADGAAAAAAAGGAATAAARSWAAQPCAALPLANLEAALTGPRAGAVPKTLVSGAHSPTPPAQVPPPGRRARRCRVRRIGQGSRMEGGSERPGGAAAAAAAAVLVMVAAAG